MQAMGWAGMFVASAGTGLIGVVLCALLGVLYTLGFIVASAGKDGHSWMVRSVHAMARWLSNNLQLGKSFDANLQDFAQLKAGSPHA